MDKLFLTVLNMSLTGAFVVAAICLARLPLKKAPKFISYCLWAVAGFRLTFPLSIESVYSLVPFNAQTIPHDIAAQAVPRIDSGIQFVNDAVRGALPAAAAAASSPANAGAAAMGASPLQVWTAVGSWVWLAGAAAMLAFGLASYVRLKRRLRSAVRVEGNLFETDGIVSPFVSGILKPRIYIPLGLSGQEREYIVLHERTHIRRHDHIVKFAAYAILCLHWFNPLAWAAFLLMGVDMEMSCDECVLKDLGGGIKKSYSMSLLSLAVGRRAIAGSPLAFGEDGVKRRIKNVLEFRRSSRAVVVLAVAFVAALSLGLIASRAGSGDMLEAQAAGAATDAAGDGADADGADAGGADAIGVDGADDGAGDANGPGSADAASDADVGGKADAGDGAEAGGAGADSATDGSADVGDGAGGAVGAAAVYYIADYYNVDDGKFSALGLALDENGSERTLTVRGGDILVVGGRRYEVIAESLTLSFYTQPLLGQAIQWWADCLDSWAESGKVTLV